MITFLKSTCEEEWLKIIDHSKIEFNFKEGDTIIHAGEELKGIYFIEEGKAKVMLDLGKEESRIIRLACNGDILGHRGFGLDKIYPISVAALTDISVVFIPLKTFEVLLKTNVKLTYKMMMFFADELKRTEQTMYNLNAEGRVARSIWSNYRAFGGENQENYTLLNYTLSRVDLANMSNTTYATTIRTLKNLEADGLIKLLGKKIAIIDKDNLRIRFNKYI